MQKYALYFFLMVFALGKVHAQYKVNGDAVALGSDCYRLTNAAAFEGGSVWYLNRVNINRPFDLYFEVFLGCKDATGADGIAFVLQPVSTNIGSAGGGLGYQGITPSFALEIDTWQNANDPTYDHLAIMSNGVTDHGTTNNLAGPVPALPNFGNIEDCQPHTLRVTWQPDSMIFRAYVDCELTITYTGNIVRDIFGNNPLVFWGFTGATGGSNNVQRFCLEYISFTEALADTAICEGSNVPLSVGSGDTFVWSPGTGLSDSTIQMPIASPLQTTTYTVEVTDLCNQKRYDTVTVRVDTAIIPPLPSDFTLCDGDSALLSAAHGGATYLWQDSSQLPTFLVTQPGTYSVTLQNACDSLTDRVVVSPQGLPVVSIQDVDCFGQMSGQANVVHQGDRPFVFSWYDAAGTLLQVNASTSRLDTLKGLAPGNYSLITLEGNGCPDTVSFSISEPPLLTLQLLGKLDIPCHGLPVGEIQVLGAGGTLPYQYSLDGVNFQSNGDFFAVGAGTYTVWIQDANGCDTSLTVTLTEPPALSLGLISQRDLACFGGTTGEITVSASGGVMPYNYSLGTTISPTGQFSGLSAGIHVLVVQDDSSCIDTLTITLSEPPALVLSVDSLLPVECHGDSTGYLSVLANGGVPSYQYALGNGSFGTMNTFSNLSASTYQLHVMDDSGCVTTLPVVVPEPAMLVGNLLAQRDVYCKGDASGWILAGGVGGTMPYQYSLDGVVFGANDTLGQLAVGNYVVYVKDSNDCMTNFPATISEPQDSLSGSILMQTNTDCFGQSLGAVTVTASGGTTPYSFAIDGRTFSPDSSFTGLSATLYHVTIRDTLGCTHEVPVVITSPTGLTSTIPVKQDIACFGDSTGFATISAAGGIGPYQYSFDSVLFSTNNTYQNLPAGQYTSYLRDANNCLVSVAFDIWEPPLLTASLLAKKDVACQGTPTGWLQAQAQGGSPPYRYSIDGVNFVASPMFSGLGAGTYTVTVRDDSLCMETFSVTLAEPAALQASIATLSHVACHGDSTGRVQFTVSGGSPPYAFGVDTLPLGPDSLFQGLFANNYVFTIQDDSGCEQVIPITITEPQPLLSNITAQVDLTCFGDSTGFVQLHTIGGVMPYMYALDQGPFGPDSAFSQLRAGTYQLTVRDDSSCTTVVPITISEPPSMIGLITSQVDILCHGDHTGEFAVSIQGGTMPYQFSLDGSAPSQDSVFAGLSAGKYQLVVTDDSSCVLSFEVELTEPDTLVLQTLDRDVRCFGEANGFAEVAINGGVTPYQIEWGTSPVQNTITTTNLPKGIYPVIVIDSNGCVARDTAWIDEPPLLELTLVDQVDAFCDWPNGSAEVAATGGISPNYTFLWSSDPTQTTAQATELFGGAYQVWVTDDNGCMDSLDILIQNTPPATPFFTTDPSATDPILFSDQPIEFINQSADAVAFFWQFGDEAGGTEEENPVYTYNDPGTYLVTLTAFNEFFVCPTTYQLELTILADGRLFFPNAFSPNDDGFNDIFYLKGEGIAELTMTIYTRWGQEITTINNLDQGWDGRDKNGQSVPEGVYTFYAKARFHSGKVLERPGTITLIR